jgi:hypothetical protein
MFAVLAASILSCYAVYCTSSETISKLGTDHLVYTIPFVIYGVLRYLYLIHEQARPNAPQKVYALDLPLISRVVLWALFSTMIIHRVI